MGKIRIRCSDADCDNDLHCYSRKRRITEASLTGVVGSSIPSDPANRVNGSCQVCGVQLVDWTRAHRRDARDVAHTIEMLNTEFVRHHFWHKDFSQWALNYVRRKGRIALRDALETRLRKSIGPGQPYRDGAQTPMDGREDGRSALYYAQHATAACCRKCVAVWHGIPKGVKLTAEQVGYLTDLGMAYFAHRLPNLADSPESVPKIARRTSTPEGWIR